MRPSSDLGGKRQGRYVLGELLGRGGMAEVFAGSSMGDHGFQKPVAIKRLIPELANDHVFVERLISEAKLLVGMQHGNIVSVLDLARDGDDVFLVMDLVDGPSLRQLIKARGSRGLPFGVSTYVVQHAAQGLEFAHMRPGGAIIHADISPSNLLLTTSGEVRVADFGIARREGLGHGVVEGKWAYMAPEQARGEALTPSSDVFALGVVLYELLTGQHPFGHRVTADVRESGQMRVIPPRVVEPAIPVGLDAICIRALSHDPRDRYPRMQPFMDALIEERFANGYREGAADLAAAIRECAVGTTPGATVGPRTQHTDRPVTIVTRSLISQPGAAARGSTAGLPDLVLAEELGSVQGGQLASVHAAPVRVWPRWMFAVLAIAAFAGIAAAVQVGSSPSTDSAPVAATPAKPSVSRDDQPSQLAAAVQEPPPPSETPTIAPAGRPPDEPRPVVEVKPKPRTPHVAIAPVHEPPAPASRHLATVKVKLVGQETWGYFEIDGNKVETLSPGLKVAAGRHRIVISANKESDEGIEPLTCLVTVPPDAQVVLVRVNLLTRKALGADSCGR